MILPKCDGIVDQQWAWASIAVAWSSIAVGVLGDSMGGDAALIATSIDETIDAVIATIDAVIAVRAAPNWLRPGSVGNRLGESDDGDELFLSYCPSVNQKVIFESDDENEMI
ncbi:hypothetical protein T492DRAFT_841923 [Pavlovales sp. CCMP2436]|nr:hypothetical protein T492DRAFT_841923 [Pavlovales sp. CCMP2436]